MIISAVALSKKFNLKTPLGASEWGIEDKDGVRYSHVSYFGHTVNDGSVRIYARFIRPISSNPVPTVLLLNDAGKSADDTLAHYFVDKGYAVLMPDYSGRTEEDEDGVFRTIYPASIEYGNLEKARGMVHMEGEADESTWFEWTYVALYSIEYLKSRHDIASIGVVGIRAGGAIAWQTMLSPSIKCGVPINAVGWTSFSGVAKFGDAVASHLSDRQHGYIAAVEAQSYAPYVKCPVLMLCALRDQSFDCDRAYDTFSRIGTEYGNALNYSENSGACIGPNGLINMDLFLAKHLKGREIYVPDTLDITLKETDEGLSVEIESDKEGILQEISVFYAESDVRTKCAYRDWQCIYHVDGKSVTGNKVKFIKKPFAGATAVFAYASAKFINGFSVVSKITAKRLSNPDIHAVKGRMLFSGKEMDAFGVALYDEYSVGDIFLERNAVPKTVEGYGGVTGAFSVGGITTYKISSPTYVPEENAFLEFDAYCREDFVLKVTVDTGDMEQVHERFVVEQTVKGGGKWKRIILKAGDFKSEISGMPLRTFRDGKALTFDCDDERIEYAITNILWL